MKRFFTIALVLCLVSSFAGSLVFASTDQPQPDKVEQITVGNQIVNVYYFSDNDTAKKFIEQRRKELSSVQLNSFKSFASEENSIEYQGTSDYDFTSTWLRNHTDEEQSMSTTIIRKHTTKASVSVSSGFKEFFSAEVGVSYEHSYEYRNTFNLTVPAGKKGLISTYNHADYYIANYNGKRIGVWRPTSNEGADVFIVDIDFPET